MQIVNVADNIFTFSPEHCDGAAFWLKTGFNFLYTDWQSIFLRQCEENGVQFHNQQGFSIANKPDPIPSEKTLYQLAPRLNALEWLYIHPNEGNLQGAATDAVHQMTLDALGALNEKGCRKVAMNGIHGAGPSGHHRIDVDEKHAALMIQALHQWSEDHPDGSIDQVYLVDLQDGFRPVLDTPQTQ